MRKFWMLTVGLVALVTACSSSTPAAPQSGTAPDLDGTSWTVTQIKGAATLANHQPTMEFVEGRVAGLASCNQFGAEYTQSGGELKIAQSAQTAMLCSPEEVMAQEQEFTAALGAVAAVRTAGDGLELLDANQAVLLTLAKLLDQPLEGTDWQLSGIIDADVVSSPVAGSTVTMQISDGQLTGQACNRFNGTVEVDGESFKTGPLMSTKMACPSEDETAQETKVLATLQAATTHSIKASQLIIKAADGTGLEFTAAK